MKSKIVIALLALSLSGCATITDIAGRRETLAICKAADVISTITLLDTGAFHETNGLMKVLMGGAHGFSPFIAVSILYVVVVWLIDDSILNTVSNAITCPVAARNILLL